jgi:hypothetical protein
MSIETKPAPMPADDRTTSGQTQLESLTLAAYRIEVAAIHVVFHSAPRRALELARWCSSWFRSHFKDGGHARHILSICASSPGLDVHSTNIPGNTSNHMHNDTNKSAPSAPAQPTVSGSTSATTPAIILQGLIGMFSEPGGNHADRTAALDLDMLLMLDATAERDLLNALGVKNLNVSTPACMNRMMDVLKHVGAVEVNSQPTTSSDIFGLKFHAQPLLDLLKAMPHREGGMGLSMDLVKDCTETNN